MREAGLTAAQVYQKELQSKDETAKVQIDVDRMMQQGVRQPPAFARARRNY